MKKQFLLLLTGLIIISGCDEQPVVVVDHESVITQDNVEIALYHYYIEGNKNQEKSVLLCPGLFQNHYAFDIEPDSSMARYLAGQGIDTWALDYRGRGLSASPEGTTDKKAPWSTDDLGYLDIASAVDYISEKSEGGKIFLLGLCEGAAAITAYLAEGNSENVIGQIGIGPRIVVGATIEDPFADWTKDQILDNFFFFIEPVIPADQYLNVPNIFQSTYSFFESIGMESQYLNMEFWQMLWNKENMTDDMVRDVIFKIFSPVSGNELKQLLRGANYFNRLGICTFEDSALEQDAGQFCYLDRLAEINVPTLIVAGNIDDFTPPVNARYIFDNIGAEDKTYRVFGIEQGDNSDYGHFDLTLGVDAQEDVYPVIAEWLLERM